MTKKFKKVFLTAFALICVLSVLLITEAKDTIKINAKLEENVYIKDNIDLGISESIKNVSCQRTGGHTDIIYNAKEPKNTHFRCRENDTVVYNCNIKLNTLWGATTSDKKETFEIKCGTGVYSQSEDNYACRPCGNSQSASYKWVAGQPPECGAAVSGIDSQEKCTALNPESNDSDTYTCRPCGNSQSASYQWVKGQSSNCGATVEGIQNQKQCSALNSTGKAKEEVPPSEPALPPQVNPNVPKISDFAETEITLDPPSRATNTVTGTCEDYIVTWDGDTPERIDVNLPSWGGTAAKYRHYSAKTNCTDNQGQEFVAFCVDPANNGPKPTSNYVIDKYLDPKDGDFSKGVVYIYKDLFLKSDQSLVAQCAAENAIRYLEYDTSVSGGISPRTSSNLPYSRDAQAYVSAVRSQVPLSGGSCAALGWQWYQAAKTASVEEASDGYGVENIEIVPDNDYRQDDNGNVYGHLLVQTPSGEPITGTLNISAPDGVPATQDGEGRIFIPEGSNLGCGDNKLTVSATTGSNGDNNVKSVLLVVNKKENSLQRFVLFQTGGSASTAGATFEFDGAKNKSCSTCQTSIDFQCRKGGSYDNPTNPNPLVLKEGTINGNGDTDWAACVYNNNDEKGNTFNALENDYCVVSCTEEWDFRLPGNIQTVSGRNFSFTAQIGAKRTCHLVGDASGNYTTGVAVTPVNYQQSDGFDNSSLNGHTSFVEDYYYWANQMVEGYNKYAINNAKAKAIEKYLENATKNNPTSRITHSDNKSSCFNESDDLTSKYQTASYVWYAGEKNINLKDYGYNAKFRFTEANSIHISTIPYDDYMFDIPSNKVTDATTATQEHSKEITTRVCDDNDPREINCQETRTTETCTSSLLETYGDSTITDLQAEVQAAAQAGKELFETAKAKIEEILEMYNECTNWENEYTFNPEIRFTYQEESYMDKILQHQNKNYLINRKEIIDKEPATFTLSQDDITIGIPGNEKLNNSVTTSTTGFTWPVSSRQCSRGYGDDGGHRGMDIIAGQGTPINPIADGEVIERFDDGSCVNNFNVYDDCGNGWGNHVIIRHSNGMISVYAHMTPGSVRVRVGDTVTTSTVIGAVGSSGPSSGYHLHLEVGTSISALTNPANYLDMSGASSKCLGSSSGGGAITNTDNNSRYIHRVESYGNTYQYISSLDSVAATSETVKIATYGESVVEYKAEDTEYRSGVYFYTINPTGEVKTSEEVDKTAPNVNPLGYVYPISLNTPQGDYPYYLNFGYVGMYNDSHRLGRIMGAAESSVLSGSAADYACKYNVCDPTIQDCPPLTCDTEIDKNGVTHYYGEDGDSLGTDENARNEYIRQCYGDPDKDKEKCIRKKDENGNDVFCDADANCSPDPSSYLKTCAKDCAGYTLVGYGNYTGAEVESSGRLQFLPKVVSLNNLFSSGNQSAKAINWQNSKAETTRALIERDGESIYGSVPDFEFEISPSAMAQIRDYNKRKENDDKGYADFNLSCKAGGIDCTSEFLNADNLASMGIKVINSIHGNIDEFKHDSQEYSWK